MKKGVLLLLFSSILLVLPLVSSLQIEMNQQFKPGETLLASLEGNFLSPIQPEQVLFYSDRVSIPLVFDIARIENKYYIYALLPLQEKNYTLLIKKVHFLENSQENIQDVEKTFSVQGNITDFSVFPGFVIAKDNFTLTLESKNKALSVDINYRNISQTENIPAGQKKKISFSGNSNGLSILSLSTQSTKYDIPVAILLPSKNETNESAENQSVSVSEAEKFRFSKSAYNFSVNSGKEQKFTIQILNLKDSEIDNISLSSSSSSITISPDNLDLKESESKDIELSVLTQDTGAFVSEINAESENVSISSDLIINVLQEDAPLPVQDDSKPSCTSLNGIVCQSSETCSGSLLSTIEGDCCIGACKEGKSYTGLIVGILLIIVVCAGLFFLYKKSKTKKVTASDVLKKKESEFESRNKPAPKEISGGLSRT